MGILDDTVNLLNEEKKKMSELEEQKKMNEDKIYKLEQDLRNEEENVNVKTKKILELLLEKDAAKKKNSSNESAITELKSIIEKMTTEETALKENIEAKDKKIGEMEIEYICEKGELIKKNKESLLKVQKESTKM